MNWSVEDFSDTVQKLYVTYKPRQDWKFRILVTSDRHLDSKFSNLRLQKKHLDEAKNNGWPVIDIGDAFDAMQGRKDFRSSRVALHNFLNDKDEYFDSLVQYGYDFLEPYASNIAMLGLGNHETSIIKHNETNLSARLVRRLKEKGSPVVLGAYSGWLKVLFETKTKNNRKGINIRYTHGAGGAAPVTKGVIKTNRRAVNFPDANIVISGHTHEAFNVPITRERISMQGVIFKDEQIHVQIPSYKDETTGLASGFAVEKEFSPKPLGAYWIEFGFDRDLFKIYYDAVRAK